MPVYGEKWISGKTSQKGKAPGPPEVLSGVNQGPVMVVVTARVQGRELFYFTFQAGRPAGLREKIGFPFR
jgi:hypothetical protein